MSIRPRLGVEVPELTARVARASNPAGTTAMWVRDRLDGLWADEDFAGWVSPGRASGDLACGARLPDLAWLVESSELGSSLSDLLDRLLPCARPARLHDGDGPA
jgi:hypothetical protein